MERILLQRRIRKHIRNGPTRRKGTRKRFRSNPSSRRRIHKRPRPILPEQLDNLVAPIALYPDQLLGEVLAASTYPMEIEQAQQFLQQYGNLQGAQLIDAAKRQNWDASVQALVAFPDAVALLARDVQWTTELGNAFLRSRAM